MASQLPRYDPPDHDCIFAERTGTRALATITGELFPLLRYNGICSCRPVAGTQSASTHEKCRGLDQSVDNDPARVQAREYVEWLYTNRAALGIQGIIFEGRIWGFGNGEWRDTHPNGNAHFDHVHTEQNEDGASLTLQQIRAALDGSEEDWLMELNKEEQRNLYNAVAEINEHMDKLFGGPTLAPENAFVGRTDLKVDYLVIQAGLKDVQAKDLAEQIVAGLGPAFSKQLLDEISKRLDS